MFVFSICKAVDGQFLRIYPLSIFSLLLLLLCFFFFFHCSSSLSSLLSYISLVSGLGLLDSPNHMDASHVFNVEDLTPYRGTFEPHVLHHGPSIDSLAPCAPLPPPQKDELEAILDDDIVSSSHNDFCHYLVQWRGQPVSDVTWIQEVDVHALSLDLL